MSHFSQFLGGCRRLFDTLTIGSSRLIRDHSQTRHQPTHDLLHFPGLEKLEERLLLTTLPAGFTETLITTNDNLLRPTAMEISPVGELWVLEQDGAAKVVELNTGGSHVAGTITVNSTGEQGLLGIAFDPMYDGAGPNADNAYVYYTASTPNIHNRLSRFVINNAGSATPTLGAETIIMEIANEPEGDNSTNHNGGAIHFGVDDKLYIAVGDHNVDGPLFRGADHVSQRLDYQHGKILRIDVAGDDFPGDPNRNYSIPADNPFVDSDPATFDEIWTLGLRNPFAFVIEPGTGRTFINDVGQAQFEEINDGVAGANYGWASEQTPGGPAEGFVAAPPAYVTVGTYADPAMAYDQDDSPPSPEGCAITGGAFYPANGQFGNTFAGKYFFADFCAGNIRVFDAANPGSLATPDTSTSFASNLTTLGPVDLKVDAAGNLYYLSRFGGGQVYRISYTAPHVFQGTTGDDVFKLQIAANSYLATVNGVTTTIPKSSFDFIRFVGLAGNDRITVQGGDADKTATLRDGSLMFATQGLQIVGSSVENTLLRGGSGVDTAIFRDSSGDDIFVANSLGAVMSGVGFYNRVRGFEEVIANSVAGGSDNALLYGSSGNDALFASPVVAVMSGADYSNRTTGFDEVRSIALDGGVDLAVLQGSSTSDTLIATPTASVMSSADYFNRATGFGQLKSHAVEGGFDSAFLYGSGDSDTLVARPLATVMSGPNYSNRTNGFDQVRSFAGAGGLNRAFFHDSAANDIFRSTPTTSFLEGPGFYNAASGYDQVFATATAGNVGGAGDQAFFGDSAGNDLFIGRPTVSSLQSVGFLSRATGFDQVRANATTGNAGGVGDRAFLYDASTDDMLFANGDTARLFGPGFSNRSSSFDIVRAFGTAGGIDTKNTSNLTFNLIDTGFENGT